MPRFQPLTVTHIHHTIRDAVVVSLAAPDGADFTYQPGQYLTFRRDFDGEEVRRSYSICAGLDDAILQVGIKKVAGGAFSTWANETLKVGDTMDAMAPMGKFTTEQETDAHRHYLGFAGGSGITPVLSILRSVLAREPHSRFTLVYANKGISTIMFREELEDLKNQYMGRLTVIHVLETEAQDIDLFTGRIDTEKCNALFAHWIDVAAIDTAFICGPEPMMLGIAAALRDHGMDDAQIKYELFASGQPGRVQRDPTQAAAAAQTSKLSTRVTVTLDGAARSFDMPRDSTVLQGALDHSVDAPYACTAGVCSTCKCKLLEGEVEMRSNHALEDYEVARGYILSCQAVPLTDRIVVDYDQLH